MSTNTRQILLDRRQQLLDCLSSAISELAAQDGYLLRINLKEEAINHRLAVYLERAIQADFVFKDFGFAIDSEYNKFGIEDKSVPNTWDLADLPARKRDRRLRPDIIVHQRGNAIDCINLLTVEVKKSSTVSKLARRYALWKSDAYRVSNLQYIFAAYVCFNTGEDLKPRQSIVRELRFFPE